MPTSPDHPGQHPPESRACHDTEECHLLDIHAILNRTATELAARYAGVFAPETVTELVYDSHALLARTARIHSHLPALAARFAADRLRAAARVQGVLVSDLPEVLFVCVHNAGRSQMAAALLDHHAAGRVRVRSAGSAPAESVNPAVIAVMDELGLDLTKEFPKPLTSEAVQAADVVITMGCGDVCPVFPGKRYLDWQLEDPAGKPVEQVRPIRDEIDTRVRRLLAELLPVA
jgi:protein-tyrosine-phosphatase